MHRTPTILMLAPLIIPLTALGCSKTVETPTGPTEISRLTPDYTGSANRALAEPAPPVADLELPTEVTEAPPVHEVRPRRASALERAERAEAHYIEAADLQALDLERLANERDREAEAREAERRAALRENPVEY